MTKDELIELENFKKSFTKEKLIETVKGAFYSIKEELCSSDFQKACTDAELEAVLKMLRTAT